VEVSRRLRRREERGESREEKRGYRVDGSEGGGGYEWVRAEVRVRSRQAGGEGEVS